VTEYSQEPEMYNWGLISKTEFRVKSTNINWRECHEPTGNGGAQRHRAGTGARQILLVPVRPVTESAFL